MPSAQDPKASLKATPPGSSDIMTAVSQDTASKGTQVKLLVFDMGHVFVDFEWETVCQGFCDRAGITRRQFKPILKHIASLGYESGRSQTADILREINAKLADLNLTEEEFHTLWNATFRENEEMAALLQLLKKDRPLYLLSNTNDSHFSYLERTHNVSRHFEELILSYLVGSSKPEEAIYREVLKRSGLKAEECLFVDDLAANIEAASKLGMNTIHFVGIQDLKQRLAAFGISC
jgi:HAD superfamily hydrolase (TIGR01509 family)